MRSRHHHKPVRIWAGDHIMKELRLEVVTSEYGVQIHDYNRAHGIITVAITDLSNPKPRVELLTFLDIGWRRYELKYEQKSHHFEWCLMPLLRQ